ncbi:MAG: glutamine amidotransferase-related protein, partial [Opitutaceae bacterium]
MSQIIAVLDFGSQLTQVIARRIRECEVYSRIYHYATPAAKLRADGVAGIILSGGPQSVYARQAPHPDPEIFRLGVPVLGI